MAHSTSDTLITVREAAFSLGCSIATVWRRAADGSIPKPVKIGGMTRWSKAEISAFIEDAKSQRAAA
jgi:excisionase family DNA binding protein